MRSSQTSRDGISLKNLFPPGQVIGAEDVFIQSCCGEWSDVRDGDLFVAIVDEKSDGHDSVEKAIAKGASAILAERMLAVDIPQFIVGNSRQAYSRICQTLAGSPSQYLKTIAVTGSDGKTTVSHLLHSILASAGETSAIASSLKIGRGHKNNNACQKTFANSLTPPDLANWLCHSTLEGCDHAILESTSVQLANHQLNGVELDAAVITNIRSNHLDYHNSVANYRQVTARILDHLKPTGFAVMNMDDPGSHQMIPDIKVPTITFGIKQQSEVQATPLEEGFSDQTFMLTAGNESAPVRTAIIGRNHIYNCLAAASTALALGIDLPTIVRGLENIQRIGGRLERVECGQEFAVFVDSATTPRRLGSTLASLRRIARRRLICVAATNGNNPAERQEFGQIIEKASDLPIISTPGIAESQQLELIHQMLDGFSNPATAHSIPDRVKAIEWALSQAKPGDCVAVLGFGEKPVISLDDGRWHLTDREICQAWLYDQPISPIFNATDSKIFRIDDFRS